ncbi:MAG: protein kinase [Acidobacteria bacterium]|nr:protein kinase [Acidobacteriota bacterium]
MPLAPGTRLGPYEILAPLGAGGMGEVYRARDPRIGREVAIKVLPSSYAGDPDRLRRFEHEVQAAGALNHPNILAIYDVGTHQGSPYIVSELLEGETLRERLSAGALLPRKAIDYALGIAQGLAAAHAKGIVHRDLKPENLFVLKDGRVKILDFGLAKLLQSEPAAEDQTSAPTLAAATEPGVVMGTIGYMSPEQVRGQAADHRADLFAFGTIVYEMLAAARAFRGASAVEVMNAILKEDPPELPAANPALERIVRRCLEKDPDLRFQSARDLAFALEALSGLSGRSAPLPASAQPRVRPAALAGVLLLVIAIAAAFFAGGALRQPPPPRFQRLTFRRGMIQAARFAPDGQTVIYAARWEGNPNQLFSTRPESPESRSLGLPEAELLGVSSSGEIALALRPHYAADFFSVRTGLLARVPLSGGAPRELLENVQAADWAPDGNGLAVARQVGGRHRLEFPAGKILYETAGFISHLRVSPKGGMVAFLDHPVQGDDGGSVAVVDLAGKKRTLTRGWLSEWGLAWSPQGDEIWFTAAAQGNARALYAVTLSGKQRLILQEAGLLTLHDISRGGRVLVSHESYRCGLACLSPGETKERELAWLDWSQAVDLSPDGKMLLFTEGGEGGGATYAVYARSTDGSPAVRLGEGQAVGLSPDGKWAIAISHPSRSQLVLLPTGAGEARALERSTMNYQWAAWFPDGRRIAFLGNEPGHGVRLYVQELAGGKARAISQEGVSSLSLQVSPDSRRVAAVYADNRLWIYPIEGGEPRPIPGAETGLRPIRWSADSGSLYAARGADVSATVYRINVSTGQKQLWKELTPSDPAGLWWVGPVLISADGRSYAYNYFRALGELALVEGLK